MITTYDSIYTREETRVCRNEGCENIIGYDGWYCDECMQAPGCTECGDIVRVSDGKCRWCFPEKLTACFVGYAGWSAADIRKHHPIAEYILFNRTGQYPHGSVMTIEQARAQFGEVRVRWSAPSFEKWLEMRKEEE